ncbi:MAG: hypothetical protein CMP07_10670 [Xanthomonadales bacterium]|nr:hypothetical protein [Xanthomonadales bacterium]
MFGFEADLGRDRPLQFDAWRGLQRPIPAQVGDCGYPDLRGFLQGRAIASYPDLASDQEDKKRKSYRSR